MKRATNYLIVFVTAPDLATARKLAKLALNARLAACANLIPKIESHYWWKGELESSSEVLIIFKTVRRNVGLLEKLILEHHPYDTPEFICTALNSGTERYLDWILQACPP